MKGTRQILVKVVVKSSQKKLEPQLDGGFKAWLTKPAIDGQANRQLIDLVAKYFGVAKSTVVIIKGQSGKIKMIQL